MVKAHGFDKGYSEVIPAGWQIKPLGDLFEFSGGYSASRDQLSETGYYYLHYGDIHGSNKSWIDTELDRQNIPKLDVSLKSISGASLLKDGDVVFVDASEDDDGTSKHIVVVNKANVPFISGLHTIVAKGKTDELTNDYRRYCFQTSYIKRQFLFYAVGTKVSGISKSNIRKILIPIPPIAEQYQIAQVLTDIDALLEVLDKTITKKHDFKLAAMQQLLTGETRLTGFSGGWNRLSLSNLVETPVTDGPHMTPKFLNSGIPFLSVNNLVDSRIDLTDLRYISKEDDEVFSRKCKPKRGDILLGKAASVGKVAIVDTSLDFNIWSPIALIRPSNNINGKFLYYQLLSADAIGQMVLMTNSSSQGNLGMGDIEKIQISFPDIEEQAAIAAVISDIDAEILALKVRRDKTNDLKQAVMQELLTGRTRLIDKELNND